MVRAYGKGPNLGKDHRSKRGPRMGEPNTYKGMKRFNKGTGENAFTSFKRQKEMYPDEPAVIKIGGVLTPINTMFQLRRALNFIKKPSLKPRSDKGKKHKKKGEYVKKVYDQYAIIMYDATPITDADLIQTQVDIAKFEAIELEKLEKLQDRQLKLSPQQKERARQRRKEVELESLLQIKMSICMDL